MFIIIIMIIINFFVTASTTNTLPNGIGEWGWGGPGGDMEKCDKTDKMSVTEWAASLPEAVWHHMIDDRASTITIDPHLSSLNTHPRSFVLYRLLHSFHHRLSIIPVSTQATISSFSHGWLYHTIVIGYTSPAPVIHRRIDRPWRCRCCRCLTTCRQTSPLSQLYLFFILIERSFFLYINILICILIFSWS